MANTVDLWRPPVGMRPESVRAWRAFYSKAMDLYGLTPADYRLLYVAQRGRCWICRSAKGVHPDDPKAAGTRRLGIDHDHRTGAVRGLLCTGGDKTCNRVIGWLPAASLLRASQYLDRPDTRPVKVLAEIRRQVADAEASGATLTQAELDKLADAFLWPGV
jgi:hypothetical protein